MASNASKIATVAIAATLAAVLLSPVATVVSDSTGTQTVTNETVTADGSFQDLKGYDIDETTVTVTDTDGNTVDSGNYTLRADAGEISVDGANSTVLTDGGDALVSYDYQAADSTTTTIAGLVPMFVALLILVTLAVKVQRMM